MSTDASDTSPDDGHVQTEFFHDPDWPRTGTWPSEPEPGDVDVAILGIPASRTSLSPTNAHETPAAIRRAIRSYSSHLVLPGTPSSRGGETQLVFDDALTIVDAGDASDPDSVAGEAAAAGQVRALAERAGLVIALGGDNAITVPATLGIAGDALATTGLITLDAHHDLRHGRSNGSPVRRLIDAGLDPSRIVQVGIADFTNSRAYREYADELGITVIHRDEFFTRSIEDIAAEALEVAGAGGGPIHVDLDVDVCDRAVAPACPGSAPGGLQAHELRRIARILVRDPRVKGVDIAEVDATADTDDQRTVKLAAMLVLEACAGYALRR